MSGSLEIIDQAFGAWVKDLTTEYAVGGMRQPVMQAEVISLACMWSIATARFGKSPRTVFGFTEDVMAHENLPKIWSDYATFSGDPWPQVKTLPYTKYLQILGNTEASSPRAYEQYAATDGRPDNQENITGLEMSLISALGHAAYNCTSGGRYLALRPTFGPPEGETYGFLRSAGPNVIEFTQNKLV